MGKRSKYMFMREMTSMTLVRPWRRNSTTVGGSDGCVVDEEVAVVVVRGDEFEALVCIEPFHCVVGGGS